MIEIIQAPNITESKGIKLFLAGGIRNCPKWQDELIEKLTNEQRIKDEICEDIKILIFNPRCKDIPVERDQIIWEDKHMKNADIIGYWFSVGSPNPITLFEYGVYLKSKKRLVVGCHPEYEKKNNVLIQTELKNPKIEIKLTFDEFYEELVEKIICSITNYRISHKV
jgi:hypothetical protein